jgi:SAM-dependent methyltransferase
MTFRRKLAKLYWVLNSQLGFDPRQFYRSLVSIPRYINDLIKFKSSYKGRLELVPCLHDWYEEAGSTKDEYFWQDLLVAKLIFNHNPKKHVDIGSRVDGFVAHVASFREIEVFDVRPIKTNIPGIIFKQADLMNPLKEMHEYCDSLSCLHALEHFGLGRYGDPIDPLGYERGFIQMISLLRPGGIFYLSLPIGIDRVEFNANRVFDPRIILKLALQNSLDFIKFSIIRSGGVVESLEPTEQNLEKLASERYNLGIFTFIKPEKF